jgi:hypothetical protein
MGIKERIQKAANWVEAKEWFDVAKMGAYSAKYVARCKRVLNGRKDKPA